MSKTENPLAFPVAGEEENEHGVRFTFYQPGMTLRDWFAGQALAGLMANANIPFAPDYAECEPEQIANASYDIADAMLSEREKSLSHSEGEEK